MGLFIGFLPAVGIQVILAFLLAGLLGANRIVAVFGTLVSNPLTVVLTGFHRLWEWEQGDQAKVLKSFCEEIGITQIKFHDLRATFITQMLNNGVPLSKVMAIVGHSSLKTTQGYLRLSGKDVEGATEDLGIQVPASEASGENIVAFRRK